MKQHSYLLLAGGPIVGLLLGWLSLGGLSSLMQGVYWWASDLAAWFLSSPIGLVLTIAFFLASVYNLCSIVLRLVARR